MRKASPLAVLFVVASCAAFAQGTAAPSAWRPGDGVQAVFSPDAWPGLLDALKSVDLKDEPYYYRNNLTIIEGWVRVEVLTPFSGAAKIVQERAAAGKDTAYADVKETLESGVLLVRLRVASAEGFKIRVILDLGGGQTKVHPVKESEAFDETASQGGYTVKVIEATFKLEDVRAGQDRLQFKTYKDAFVMQFFGNIKPERCWFKLLDLR